MEDDEEARQLTVLVYALVHHSHLCLFCRNLEAAEHTFSILRRIWED